MTKLVNKIIQIQGKLKAPKNQTNTYSPSKFKYRSAEDILEALKPLLVENQVLQTISDEIVLIGDRYYIKATVTVTYEDESLSVTGYARETLSRKGMDDSQVTGSTSSYARKYALNGMWAIDDTKDSDTDEYHEQTTKEESVLLSTEEVKEIQEGLISEYGRDETIEAWKLMLANFETKTDSMVRKLKSHYIVYMTKLLEGWKNDKKD